MGGGSMPDSFTDACLAKNADYAANFDKADLPIPPAGKAAVVACMDARLDPAGLLGLSEGDAHVIRNAGGVVSDDVIRSLVISQRLLGTEEIILVHHTDCGMVTFKDDDLKAAIEADTGLRPTFLHGSLPGCRGGRSPVHAPHRGVPLHSNQGPRPRLRLRRRDRSLERGDLMANWRTWLDQARSTVQALRQIVADPEDTPKVFEITRTLGRPSIERGVRRFRATPVGRRILAERIDLLDALQQREALAKLPAGTLGRAYYDFVYRENLSADGLVEASMAAETRFDNADTRRYAERLREQHDLWHTLTGYGRDPFGEVCLLAFTYAQTGNRGIGLIVLVGALKGFKEVGPAVPRAIWSAYRGGRHASWLPAEEWERALRAPLKDVRRSLAIPRPARPYREYAATAQPAAA